MRVERGNWIIDATMSMGPCPNCGMERPLAYGVKSSCGCGVTVSWHIPTQEEWEEMTTDEP